MAAHPIVVIEHGRAEVPEELQADPQFKDGARVQLIPVSVSADNAVAEDVLARWESLRGVFADSEFDPNAELETDKQRELAAEAEWLRR
jgi:hypothetical protein